MAKNWKKMATQDETDETKSGVNFLQLNLHKSEKCNAELNKWLMDNEDSVALCQEPAHKKVN